MSLWTRALRVQHMCDVDGTLSGDSCPNFLVKVLSLGNVMISFIWGGVLLWIWVGEDNPAFDWDCCPFPIIISNSSIVGLRRSSVCGGRRSLEGVFWDRFRPDCFWSGRRTSTAPTWVSSSMVAALGVAAALVVFFLAWELDGGFSEGWDD